MQLIYDLYEDESIDRIIQSLHQEIMHAKISAQLCLQNNHLTHGQNDVLKNENQ